MFGTIYTGADTALKNKYIDYYAYSGTSGTAGRQPNYVANLDKRGDATVETSISSESPYTSSWFSDYSYFMNSGSPWFIRGGYYGSTSYAGVFCFGIDSGDSLADISFRPVFVYPL